jgi:hypothetical protein
LRLPDDAGRLQGRTALDDYYEAAEARQLDFLARQEAELLEMLSACQKSLGIPDTAKHQ